MTRWAGATDSYHVVVVGAGNAALCTGLAAAQTGASVLVVEKAEEYLRGGNTYFTGGLFRFAYDGSKLGWGLGGCAPRNLNVPERGECSGRESLEITSKPTYCS